MFLLFTAQALTCYCIGQYCTQPSSESNSYDESMSQFSSCEAKPGAKCFSAVTQVEDIVTGEHQDER